MILKTRAILLLPILFAFSYCSKSKEKADLPKTTLFVYVTQDGQPSVGAKVILYKSVSDFNKDTSRILIDSTDKDGIVRFKDIEKTIFYIRSFKGCYSNVANNNIFSEYYFNPIKADMTDVKEGGTKGVGFGIVSRGNIKIVNPTSKTYNVTYSTGYGTRGSIGANTTIEIKDLESKDYTLSIEGTNFYPHPVVKYNIPVSCGETTVFTIP